MEKTGVGLMGETGEWLTTRGARDTVTVMIGELLLDLLVLHRAQAVEECLDIPPARAVMNWSHQLRMTKSCDIDKRMRAVDARRFGGADRSVQSMLPPQKLIFVKPLPWVRSRAVVVISSTAPTAKQASGQRPD